MTVSAPKRQQALAVGQQCASREATIPVGEAGHDQRVQQSRDLLQWAQHAFGQRLTIASSMGDEVLIHLVGTTLQQADVFFIDTGYHFPETVGTKDAYQQLLPITLRTITPARSVAEQDAEHGEKLYERQPDRCCHLRKVLPLRETLQGYDAWVTGMRRAEAITRVDLPFVDHDQSRDMIKINPLAAWSDQDVDRYVSEHDVFLNPLRQLGYTSIGCAPCTRATSAQEDPRAGRWPGTGKTECGLHTH